MTSREAVAHEIARISRELHRAVQRLRLDLSEEVYEQLDQSTFSIGSNFSEYAGRLPKGGALQFLKYAHGSAYEAAFQFSCIGFPELEELAHIASELLDKEIEANKVDPVAAHDKAQADRFAGRFKVSQESHATPGRQSADVGTERVPEEDPTQRT